MFTLVGSLPMLLGVLMLAFADHGPSRTPNLEFASLTGLPAETQIRLFFLFLLAFMVKMPIVPFHGWLAPLYRNAPASAVAVIAAMMSKAGTYGLYKIGFTIFPQAMIKYLPFVGSLVVLSLLYGAFAAIGSESLREVLAFSSLSHIAMIALGIVTFTTVGAAGANLQMAGHALATGGLFLAVALMEKRDMPDELRRFGGMAQIAPRFAALVLFLTLASLGQPGLGSFPGELLILTGVYENFAAVAVVACLAIVLAAGYMLRWYQTIFTGELGTYRASSDLRGREVVVLLVPILLSLLLGFAPSIFLQPIQSWLTGVV
jgi:NADH-quinone oxidoreductase subunit M